MKRVRHRLPPLLLDTNTVTFVANRNPVTLDHLDAIGEGVRLATCFVVVGEWEYGVCNAVGAARQEALRRAGHLIFDLMSEIWDSSREIALAYGKIHAYLRQTGQLIPTNDIWIAAAAQVNGATVVTTDAHFGRVPGLSIQDWSVP